MLSKVKRGFSAFKKLVIVFIVFSVIISVFLQFISQDIPKRNPPPDISKEREEAYELLANPELQKTTEGKISVSLFRGLFCTTIGEYCTNNPDDADQYFKKSALGFTTNLIAMPLTHPPASGIMWAQSGLEKVGIVPQVYAAQGIGLSALYPFQKLWNLFRSIAYMMIVIIIVAIGFMVMFRMKLNAQTVISAENALPRIVLALLMITFSFPIAGFLIDLMYVLINLLISIFSNGNNALASTWRHEFLFADVGTLGSALFPDWQRSGWNPLEGLGFMMDLGNQLLRLTGPVEAIVRIVSGGYMTMFFSSHTSNIVGFFNSALGMVPLVGSALQLTAGVFTHVMFAVLGGAFGYFVFPQLLLAVVILFTVLLLMFRIFFILLRSYLQILALTVFSPIILLFEAVPGKNAFSFWFKQLFVEVLTFPIVIGVFVFGQIIVQTLNDAAYAVWAPPFLYGIDPRAFSFIAGVGIVYMTPEILKLAKELMGVKGGLPISVGPGAFFAGAGAGAGGAFGMLSQFGSMSYYLGHTPLRGVLAKLPYFDKMFKDASTAGGHGGGGTGGSTHSAALGPMAG